MKVNKAEIIISAVEEAQYPSDELLEFALIGRSNVGKSSFINAMINRKALARTSSQPGKTQTMNFYLINEMFRFVDLPGYGYAKVSQKEREKWGQMIEKYLSIRENLQCVLLLVDFRHPPTRDDIAMYQWLKHFQIKTAVIATKLDKVKRSQHQKNKKMIKEDLQLNKGDALFTFSAQDKTGKEEIWQFLEDILKTNPA
ncbi:ribosome biogenesis GTP-binding protein YihA/YsxC [Irregularibacter muris]|uniref:Probable GTP-binding protein EngB n=1 Tax=Irregularibacter muris TaxID=1796619 RepID=A0AAE3HGS3_9FIRM|nr:ribosome biogenesis GTP-binding protein YihA/YsxC [Irregularibacter muris]MCR1898759.1 ribosome biogenesis GTP-binding protein YihA/YsxC [Irregularibacter muris]